MDEDATLRRLERAQEQLWLCEATLREIETEAHRARTDPEGFAADVLDSLAAFNEEWAARYHGTGRA